MNDLVVMNNQTFAFRNEELVQSVNRIRAYSRSMEESSFHIALELKHIKDDELYKEDGYSNIIEFSSKVFGYQKTTTYYLLTMAENLLVSQGEEVRTIFARDNQDFSVNQLREMITLDIGTIEELVKSEKLVPSMSIKQVRKTVKSKKKEKNLEINQIPDVGKTENRGINSEVTADSISSSSLVSSEESDNLSAETPSQTAQDAPESLSNSSLVSEYQKTSETPSEGNSSSDSSYQPISNSDIDYLISRLNDEDEESKEEFPVSPYEFTFFNCKSEQSESKRIDQIELDELVYSDIVGRLSSELKGYIELAKKEIKRLNYFSNLKSVQIEELSREVERLREENFKLLHPTKRKRGRPRKNQD